MGVTTGGFGLFAGGSGGGGSGIVETIVAGRNITVDSTDPANPIVSTTADDIIVVANYSALPDPTTVSNNPFYWCSASQGTKFVGVLWGGAYYPAGMYYSNGVSWEYMDTPSQATQAEVDAGTVTNKWVSPSTFTNASLWASKKNISTGNAYRFETTDASGNLQETSVTASRAVVTDANGLPSASATTSTEIGYVSGVTSSIQTQLNAKQNIPVNGYYGNPFFSTNNNTILDSTSIFFGQVTSGANSVANSSGVPQVAGKVIGFAITGFNASTVGSNEDCTIVFHYNNVVNSTTISTTFKVSGNRSFYQEITGLNIDITSGNTCIELQTPALATNPNAFRLYAVPIFKIQ